MASEKSILNDILVDLSAEPETLVWRNNTGMGWQGRELHLRIGQTFTVEPRMKILAEARPVKFGLPGSSDIIGVSRRYPLAVEVKDEDGAQDRQQILFERAWTKVGGIYILARSREEATTKLRDYI